MDVMSLLYKLQHDCRYVYVFSTNTHAHILYYILCLYIMATLPYSHHVRYVYSIFLFWWVFSIKSLVMALLLLPVMRKHCFKIFELIEIVCTRMNYVEFAKKSRNFLIQAMGMQLRDATA